MFSLTEEKADKLREIIERIGPNKKPYEGVPGSITTSVEPGEDIVFGEFIFHVEFDTGELPLGAVTAEPQDILDKNTKKIENATYLWVIDDNGLHIILEQTPNPFRSHKLYVCHTNITGCEPARQGGELWFGTDGIVYINNKSGRYGGRHIPKPQRQAIRDYFEFFGYQVVQVPDFPPLK